MNGRKIKIKKPKQPAAHHSSSLYGDVHSNVEPSTWKTKEKEKGERVDTKPNQSRTDGSLAELPHRFSVFTFLRSHTFTLCPVNGKSLARKTRERKAPPKTVKKKSCRTAPKSRMSVSSNSFASYKLGYWYFHVFSAGCSNKKSFQIGKDNS